jgi:hypothetical protein
MTELDKVKWSDLTYKRVHDFVEAADTTISKLCREKFRKWQSKYGKNCGR